MRRRAIQFIGLWAIVLSTTAITCGAEFAGGTGTADNPYLIATAEQLIFIGSDPNLQDRHFILVGDVDLDPGLSPDYTFNEAVIGSFAGVFDGGGYCIRHLTVRGVTLNGLFAVVDYGAEVKKLILEDVDIAFTNAFGAGAVCGLNHGLVLKCYATGTLSGNGLAGGLVGRNEGIVEECGGICTVSATSSGGLVGWSSGHIRDSYACSNVSGVSAGGFMAIMSRGGISRCYATGTVKGTGDNAGGLIALTSLHTADTDSYFLAPCDGGGPDNGLGTPLTSVQMKQAESFAGWDFWGATDDDLRAPWYMPQDTYPELVWLALPAIPTVSGLPVEDALNTICSVGVQIQAITYDYDHAVEYGHVILTRPRSDGVPGTIVDIIVSLGTYDWSANPGTGEPNDRYLVLSAGQLDCLAHQPQLWDKHFRLINDLDMTSRVYHSALLGASDQGNGPFAGGFDGNGHIISGLTIEGVSASDGRPELLGLFGEIVSSARVSDLGLRDVSIRGRGYHQAIGGMFCGVNAGRIERCYSQGRLRGYGWLGGLVGSNTGVIADCYSQGEVEELSHRDTRGFYAGLVAENTAGAINTCYAACVVPEYGAGLVDHNGSGSVKHGLWDTDISGVSTSDGGTAVSTLGLMDARTLGRNGWGGSSNWVIDDGQDYPRLIWEGTPGSYIPLMRERQP